MDGQMVFWDVAVFWDLNNELGEYKQTLTCFKTDRKHKNNNDPRQQQIMYKCTTQQNIKQQQ